MEGLPTRKMAYRELRHWKARQEGNKPRARGGGEHADGILLQELHDGWGSRWPGDRPWPKARDDFSRARLFPI